MDLLQEYKELYYKELELSERLSNKSSICITFITVLGSAQILLWTQFKSFEISIYSVVYLALCIISLLAFAFCAFKFYFAYSGYNYNYFPIEDMVSTTEETYKIAGSNKKDIKLADKYIYNMYCERFLNDTIHNRNENIRKNNKHKKLTQYICISFIISAIVFAYGIGLDYYETKYIDKNAIHVIIEGGEINGR